MQRLGDLVGSEVVMSLVHPILEQPENITVTKLTGVEDSGIWIEGRDLANTLHESKQMAIIPKMPLFFVPFSQIAWIVAGADYPSLSESNLGV